MRKFMILLPIIFGFLVANFTAVSDGTYWMYIIQVLAILFSSATFGALRFWKSKLDAENMFTIVGIPLYISVGFTSYVIALLF